MVKRYFWMVPAFVAALSFGCGDNEKVPRDGGGRGDAGAGGDGGGSGARWSEAPKVIGGPVQETAAVALGGKIYVIGGLDAARTAQSTVRIYDTATKTWSYGPALPKAVHHANAAVVRDTIYVLGSSMGGDVWAWNPATGTGWTTRTCMPAGTERGAAVAGAIGDAIYVAGGLRADGAQATVSSYTPATDTWQTNLPPLPQINDHGCGGVVDGKLYVIGGRKTTTAENSAMVFEYTPTGGWVVRAPMPTARGGTACGVINGRIIVAGGEGNPSDASGVFPDVEAYDVAQDRWEPLPPMPTPRHGMAGAVWDDAFYVPGGATRLGFAAVDTHEVLRP